jgi:hypothetical protein
MSRDIRDRTEADPAAASGAEVMDESVNGN